MHLYLSLDIAPSRIVWIFETLIYMYVFSLLFIILNVFLFISICICIYNYRYIFRELNILTYMRTGVFHLHVILFKRLLLGHLNGHKVYLK